MKKRLITAIVLLAFVLPPVILGGWYFVALMALFLAIGTYEVLKVREDCKWPITFQIICFFGMFILTFWNFLMVYYSEGILSIPSPYLVHIPVVLIGIFLMLLFVSTILDKKITVNDIFYCFTMITFISIAGQSALFAREFSINAFVFVAVATFLTDTCAYFTGYLFGKNKMAPDISPKKTWEGAIGGTIGGTLFGILSYVILPFSESLNIVSIAILAFMLALGAQFGDLTFSKIKRNYGIKDFGTIFPGHGGVLDRVDSLLFNFILFVSVFALFSGGLFV